jgi:hypothetical protein
MVIYSVRQKFGFQNYIAVLGISKFSHESMYHLLIKTIYFLCKFQRKIKIALPLSFAVAFKNRYLTNRKPKGHINLQKKWGSPFKKKKLYGNRKKN